LARKAKGSEKGEPQRDVLSLLQRYCAYQDRCRQDILEKLKENEVPAEEYEHYLSMLEEEGFLNESRFARVYTRGHFRKNKWGRLRIRQALKQKNISDRDIDAALEEIDETYNDALFILLEKKFATLKDTKDKTRTWQKLTQFALQKGYEGQVIYDSLRKLLD
jgi:regulatory protein